MAQVPVTSISLLKGLAQADSARWLEFVDLYEATMRAFLLARYPSVEADDVIQLTLIALAERLPGYHYTPDSHGHFRSYLTGILRHKAEDVLRRRARESARLRKFADEAVPGNGDEEESWKVSAMHAALDQLLADETTSPRNREIFRHVAVLHESPAEVAAAFGVRRDTVDQIKHRGVERLRKLVASMTKDL